jgi:adenine-specific DNA-methyltransferase
MVGKKVFAVGDGGLLVCLEKEITPELIDALAEANPLQVICLDDAFEGNDQLKANAVQTFKARALAEESEIVFRTV